jgi:uncharacterized lipoprotein YbaY
MKRRSLFALAACAGLLLAGCGHVDLTPESDPNRVLTGTINVRMDLLPPSDSEIVVRLVDAADVTAAPAIASQDVMIGERGLRERPEQVLAEQVIHAPARMPVAFRLDYRADDATLRRGLNLEARMSWGGRVRFRTLEGQNVTLVTAGEPQVIWLEAAR